MMTMMTMIMIVFVFLVNLAYSIPEREWCTMTETAMFGNDIGNDFSVNNITECIDCCNGDIECDFYEGYTWEDCSYIKYYEYGVYDVEKRCKIYNTIYSITANSKYTTMHRQGDEHFGVCYDETESPTSAPTESPTPVPRSKSSEKSSNPVWAYVLIGILVFVIGGICVAWKVYTRGVAYRNSVLPQ